MLVSLAKTLVLGAALALAVTAPAAAMNNGAALTPPMGWLSWAWFRCELNCTANPTTCISERLYMDMADQFVSRGLRDAGYEYINIGWSTTERDADGNQQADPVRFPHGIKWLADYMHERGLKLGLYSDIGNYTCNRGSFTGMGGHFEQDSKTFASWGIDSLKVDGCNYPNWQNMNESYPALGRALNAAAAEVGRPIVYICSWPAYQLYKNAPLQFKLMKKYCNQWRNSYDIQNDFSAVQEHIESWAGLKTHNVPYKTFVDTNGPGSWNDPDQVLVGNGLFTPEQSRTIMSMWCLWSAPMLLSNDLRNISDWELEILLNKELIAVNQDPLGRQGYMIYNTTWNSTHTIRNNLLHADENGVLLRKPRSLTLATMRDPAQPQVDAGAAPPPPSNNAIVQVWRKDMSDDSTIALVYNTAVGRDCPISLDLQFEDFGFANITRVAVRDLWKHRDVGIFTTQFTVTGLNCSDSAVLKFSLAD